MLQTKWSDKIKGELWSKIIKNKINNKKIILNKNN